MHCDKLNINIRSSRREMLKNLLSLTLKCSTNKKDKNGLSTFARKIFEHFANNRLNERRKTV